MLLCTVDLKFKKKMAPFFRGREMTFSSDLRPGAQNANCRFVDVPLACRTDGEIGTHFHINSWFAATPKARTISGRDTLVHDNSTCQDTHMKYGNV